MAAERVGALWPLALQKRLDGFPYLDNVTLNKWSAGPSQTVLLYVPVGVSPILNYGGEELHGATLRVAFGKGPNSQRRLAFSVKTRNFGR